jgi:hypothetical protein
MTGSSDSIVVLGSNRRRWSRIRLVHVAICNFEDVSTLRSPDRDGHRKFNSKIGKIDQCYERNGASDRLVLRTRVHRDASLTSRILIEGQSRGSVEISRR